MLGPAITAATVPVRAVITGSPVLAARLWAPAVARRDKAAEEREAIAQALAEARAAELTKLTDEKAIAKAKAAHAEADKAARAERRGRASDIVGGGILVGIVAGPVSWSLVGPWVPLATWSAAGLWCVAAMMHAPTPVQAETEEHDEDDDEPGETGPGDLRQAVVDRLLGWVGDRRGIHLAEVYERYRQQPGHGHLTDTQIRTALVDHYRIPVRPGVRTPDGVRAGIHRDDLQPLPSPATTAPVADDRNTPVTSTVAA
jgi:hypothetical protein